MTEERVLCKVCQHSQEDHSEDKDCHCPKFVYPLPTLATFRFVRDENGRRRLVLG